ncbi:hypothetical protein JVT61DRAFT_4984 [Boletus reticuloceps]|uniref:Uncharacterized protein n=1 Tax=Boletus reticuloceps TaxID=495285 RepID=A0A8I3ACS0_9AGAM|nr:hypothetical protein JVT61DRAFT_4984 [Boletus reticuloceps]
MPAGKREPQGQIRNKYWRDDKQVVSHTASDTPHCTVNQSEVPTIRCTEQTIRPVVHFPHDSPKNATPLLPLAHSNVSLNTAGVVDSVGGEEVLSIMGIMHLYDYEGGRWLAGYNSTGNYTITKHLARMANSRF